VSDPFPVPVLGRQPSVRNQAMAMAREHTPAAINVLAQALRSDDERVAVTAATVLLDRAWGRAAPAPPEAGDERPTYVIRGPTPTSSTEEWLRKYAPPRTIDADPTSR
jgi:HEAT repeat protein